jgi:glycosyltransferase involved in cell wall biosynthesis
MMRADVLLLAIPQINENKGILTGKLFEYMATGNPILGIGPPDGDVSKILDETHSGKMFDYDKQNEVFSFLSHQYELWHKGSKIRKLYPEVEKYSRKALTAELAQIIDHLLSQ